MEEKTEKIQIDKEKERSIPSKTLSFENKEFIEKQMERTNNPDDDDVQIIDKEKKEKKSLKEGNSDEDKLNSDEEEDDYTDKKHQDDWENTSSQEEDDEKEKEEDNENSSSINEPLLDDPIENANNMQIEKIKEDFEEIFLKYHTDCLSWYGPGTGVRYKVFNGTFRSVLSSNFAMNTFYNYEQLFLKKTRKVKDNTNHFIRIVFRTNYLKKMKKYGNATALDLGYMKTETLKFKEIKEESDEKYLIYKMSKETQDYKMKEDIQLSIENILHGVMIFPCVGFFTQSGEIQLFEGLNIANTSHLPELADFLTSNEKGNYFRLMHPDYEFSEKKTTRIGYKSIYQKNRKR